MINWSLQPALSLDIFHCKDCTCCYLLRFLRYIDSVQQSHWSKTKINHCRVSKPTDIIRLEVTILDRCPETAVQIQWKWREKITVVSLQRVLTESKTQAETGKALWSTSLTWLDAVDIDLGLHVSKWYTNINPGGLFRVLVLTELSHSAPPSYAEIMKREERNKILIFLSLQLQNSQLKDFKSCQNFLLLKNHTRIKAVVTSYFQFYQ